MTELAKNYVISSMQLEQLVFLQRESERMKILERFGTSHTGANRRCGYKPRERSPCFAEKQNPDRNCRTSARRLHT